MKKLMTTLPSILLAVVFMVSSGLWAHEGAHESGKSHGAAAPAEKRFEEGSGSSALGADREAYEEKGDHAGKKEGSGIFPLGSFHERYEDKEKEPRKTGMEKGRGTEPAGSGKREEGSGMR